MTVVEQLTLAPPAAAGAYRVEISEANDLLVRWGHYLGPCRRPFHQEGWVLVAGGRPVSVAVSASTVSPEAAGYRRGDLVELARLCSAERWATRVMVRTWREVLAPAWECWPPAAAVAYSKNDRHDGRTYRFDGWARVTNRAGNPPGPGATWSRQPARSPARGRKTLWLWHYQSPAVQQQPGGER